LHCRYAEIALWDFATSARKAGASGATGHFTQVRIELLS